MFGSPLWLETERWGFYVRQAGRPAGRVTLPPERTVLPMLTPLRVRGVLLKNRIVVSPMAQYSAADGVAGDYHLVHLVYLGARDGGRGNSVRRNDVRLGRR